MKEGYSILEGAKYYEKLFDFVRIVDPIHSKIVEFPNNTIELDKHKCFDYWNRHEPCVNCTSFRAYKEKETFVKVEYKDGKIFWVMSAPFDENGKECVLEAVKDITDSGVIEGITYKTKEEIKTEIERMNLLVVTDELTGSFNRRYINERLPMDITKSIEDNSELTIALMDIDFFKNINDAFGHLAGDFVLKELVKIIKSNIRESIDWVARYGGEEFLIVFNHKKCNEVISRIEKIRNLIAKHDFIFDNMVIKVTGSFGVACTGNGIDDINKLIQCADKNLYKAKHNGRNIIVCDL